ncbi:MAG: serine protease [Firmicutes bacterium]|nr:serine protease [Bacillota bacterium]
MLLQEVNWIRLYSHKFCPLLRKAALEWYRPLKLVPCFIQKPIKFFKQKWYKKRVIVQLKDNPEGSFLFTQLASLAGCRIEKKLPLINSFATKVNAKSLQVLAQNDYVHKIWFDRDVKAVLDVASPTVGSPPLWDKNVDGKGIVVAVLDTGIFHHPDLSDRIKDFVDLINQKTDTYDDNGHGTHVAGDIASSGIQSELLFRGPAPEAQLVGVKVLDKMGSGSISTVIEGIQWCVDNKDTTGISVLNMSLGAAATESYTNDPVCQAVEKAWRAGLVVCVAAGNDGPQPQTIGSPGIDPIIITVGALDDAGTIESEDDRVAGFSSRGPTIDGLTKPDVIAPGNNIISLRSPGSMLDKKSRDGRVNEWYTSLSGTSMATPVCAGVVAQMLQANGSLTPDQVKASLMESARTLDLDPNIQGAGIIDAQSAVNAITKEDKNSD